MKYEYMSLISKIKHERHQTYYRRIDQINTGKPGYYKPVSAALTVHNIAHKSLVDVHTPMNLK